MVSEFGRIDVSREEAVAFDSTIVAHCLCMAVSVRRIVVVGA